MKGYALIDSLHGSKQAGFMPAEQVGADGWTPSQQTIAEYEPNLRKGKCIAKDHTCEGFRTRDSKYCAGHKRAAKASAE